jgi:hypothetical protein
LRVHFHQFDHGLGYSVADILWHFLGLPLSFNLFYPFPCISQCLCQWNFTLHRMLPKPPVSAILDPVAILCIRACGIFLPSEVPSTASNNIRHCIHPFCLPREHILWSSSVQSTDSGICAHHCLWASRSLSLHQEDATHSTA